MGDISEYFSRKEVACRCKCGLDSMDSETLEVADWVREMEGGAVEVLSGARCLTYNRSKHVGSNDRSQHPKCRAMDLKVCNPQKTYDALCSKYPDKYGFGLYSWGIHIDTRTGGAKRWIG